ncbi:hypothetical protein CHISP_1534 [Chitinispirillum alkaliphilum]|nr:hypothetical protein CHISP_1534 [Chitinispirillum alkaliphilum]
MEQGIEKQCYENQKLTKVLKFITTSLNKDLKIFKIIAIISGLLGLSATILFALKVQSSFMYYLSSAEFIENAIIIALMTLLPGSILLFLKKRAGSILIQLTSGFIIISIFLVYFLYTLFGMTSSYAPFTDKAFWFLIQTVLAVLLGVLPFLCILSLRKTNRVWQAQEELKKSMGQIRSSDPRERILAMEDISHQLEINLKAKNISKRFLKSMADDPDENVASRANKLHESVDDFNLI